MVKIKGPMMSLDASGTLGDAVTFSKWKGRAYVRERVIPSNPKSGAQVGRRAMFIFLTQQWTNLSAANKATWQELADQLVASPFSAYVSANMENWHNFLTPMKTATGARIQNPSDHALTAAAWEENRIKLSVSGTVLNYYWGIAFHAKLAGAVTPAVGNCILVVRDVFPHAQNYYWTPPSAGRWYFDSIAFSIDGKQNPPGGSQDTGP